MNSAILYDRLTSKPEYYDRKSKHSPEEYKTLLRNTSTVYVGRLLAHLGNLSIYTREEAIYELFSKCGDIKLLKMGLNRKNKTPCGFCFVE
jgi:nuclear cap-binding protein subunit 2